MIVAKWMETRCCQYWQQLALNGENPTDIFTYLLSAECYNVMLADLLFIDCDPVDIGQPVMTFDVVDTIFQDAVSLGEINLQQVFHQVLQVAVDMVRITNLQRPCHRLHRDLQ